MARILCIWQPTLLVAICALFGISSGSDASNLKELSKLNNQLALDLHKALSAEENGNIFISPFSISTALAMLFYGTRGQTEEEMNRIMGYDESDLSKSEIHSTFQSLLTNLNSPGQKDYLLYVANALLAQKDFPIESKYKEDLQRLYLATARDVDFEKEGKKVAGEINEWVSQATKGNIKKLFDDVDPSTVLVILNAVYFKGTWLTEFDPEFTGPGDFYNLGKGDSKVNVQKMRLEEELPYIRLGGVRGVELPYKGKDVSMVILLPDAKDGVSQLEKSLMPNMVRDIRSRMKKTKVEVALPKFKLEYEKELKDVLEKLGLKKIFQNNADLGGISKAGNLVVSKVTHKAVVEVNEQGSEASGITGIGIETRMGSDTIVFNVEHPFLFAIVDTRTDMIYFQGRVAEL